MNTPKKNLTEIIDDFDHLYEKKIILEETETIYSEIKNTINDLNKLIETLENNIRQLEQQYNKLDTISKKFFHPIKNNKERKKIAKELKDLKIKLQTEKEKIIELENRKKELTEKINALKIDVSLLPDCIKKNKNGLIIFSNNVSLLAGCGYINKKIENGITISSNERFSRNRNMIFGDNPPELMIHVTDFYPRDRMILSNYDGNKFGVSKVSYNGVKKECESLIHRHSVHFTINNVVKSTGDGAGNWEQPKYVVIDPMYAHKNDNIKNKSPSDSWTYGSIKISDKALLLVNEEYLSELPNEAYNDYKVIVYSGNYVTCVRNVILSITGEVYETDQNAAGHADSEEMKCETILNNRNLLINYIKNNSYKGKEEITFSEEEVQILYKMMIENLARTNDIRSIKGYYEITKKFNLNEDELCFYYLFGFVKNQDGTFSIKNDEEMYNQICNPNVINIDQIQAIRQILQNNSETKTRDLTHEFNQKLSQMTISDLYRFENQKYAEYFQKIVEEYFKEISEIDGITIGGILIKSNGQFLMEATLYSGMDLTNIVDGNFSFEKDYEFRYNYNTIYSYELMSNNNMTVSEALLLINKLCQKVKIESQHYKQNNLENINNTNSPKR